MDNDCRETYRFSFINREGRDIRSELMGSLARELTKLYSVHAINKLEVKRMISFPSVSVYDTENWGVVVDYIPSSRFPNTYTSQKTRDDVRSLIKEVVKLACERMSSEYNALNGLSKRNL